MKARTRQQTRVAKARLSLGLQQKDFAKLLGVSVHAVISLELGRLALSERTALKLAKINGRLNEMAERPEIICESVKATLMEAKENGKYDIAAFRMMRAIEEIYLSTKRK